MMYNRVVHTSDNVRLGNQNSYAFLVTIAIGNVIFWSFSNQGRDGPSKIRHDLENKVFHFWENSFKP